MITTHKFEHCNVLGKVFPSGQIYLSYRWEKVEKEWLTFNECECDIWYYVCIRINEFFTHEHKPIKFMFRDNKKAWSTYDITGDIRNYNMVNDFAWNGFLYKKADK